MNLRSSHITAFLVSTGLVVLYSFTLTPYYNSVCVLASLISLILVLINLVLYLKTKERIHLLFAPILVLTWIYFLRPYLKSYEVQYVNRTIPLDHINEMAIFSALGLIALFVGYYSAFNRKKISPLSPINLKFSYKTLGTFTLFFLALSVFQRIVSIYFPDLLSSLGQILQILNYAPSITFALLVLYYLRKGRSPFLLFITIAYLLIEYFFRVAETLFANIIYLFAGGLVVYLLEKKKIPYMFLLAFIIINFPIYITRSKFRTENVVDRWYHGKSQSFSEIVSEGVDNISIIYSTWSLDDIIDNIKEKDQPKEDRMEQVSYLGQCVFMHTTGRENFRNGSTFWWLPLAPIPRAIFPMKPENILATTIAHEYGLKGDTHGAMNFPLLAEYYINFGFWGIIILSFFQGMATKWIYLKVHYGLGDINLIILLNLIFYMIEIEANITMVYGGILQVLLFWWILLKFFVPKKALNASQENRNT
jgi:hypothetical protein